MPARAIILTAIEVRLLRDKHECDENRKCWWIDVVSGLPIGTGKANETYEKNTFVDFLTFYDWYWYSETVWHTWMKQMHFVDKCNAFIIAINWKRSCTCLLAWTGLENQKDQNPTVYSIASSGRRRCLIKPEQYLAIPGVQVKSILMFC